VAQPITEEATMQPYVAGMLADQAARSNPAEGFAPNRSGLFSYG
jgi:hypothetical protein